ncbi:MAG: type II secretion system F family protein [Dermatophilaceae bacterium]
MIWLITLGVMLTLAGLALGVALLAGVSPPQRAKPDPLTSPPGRTRRWRREQLLAIPIGVAVMLATGWVGAGLGAVALALAAPGLLRPSAASQRHITRLEALASWTRRVADLLACGAAQTLQDALARAAVTSPAPVQVETRALATRMGPQGIEPALRQFAKEVADPVGDHVAMALIVRARHGATGLADVLTALASDVDEQVRMRRAILSEQKKAVSNVRMILAVTLIVWLGLSVFARDYMTPYTTAAGQLALTVIVAGFAATIAWLQRLSRPVVGARFLADLDDSTELAPAAGNQSLAGPG